MMRSLAASAAGGVVAAAANPFLGQTSGDSATRRPRVLALVGDRFHNADYIVVALGRLFRELEIPVDFTINYASISAALLRDYQLFVCLRDGFIWPNGYSGPDAYSHYASGLENPQDWPKEESRGWITPEQGKAIKDFVLAGNGFYALHNSSHISLYSKDYRDVMGGAYGGHPALRPFKVHVVNRDHPITRGVKDYFVNDEQHYLTYDKVPQHVLFKSENMDGLVYENFGTSSNAGWAYDYGKGRVAFTAGGHTLHALWHPEYFKIQKNAVRWLLKLA